MSTTQAGAKLTGSTVTRGHILSSLGTVDMVTIIHESLA